MKTPAPQRAAGRKKLAAMGQALSDGCLAAETLVVTPDGDRPIADLVGPVEILTDAGWRLAEVREFGVRPLRTVVLCSVAGERLVYATPNHRWYLADGTVIVTDQLSVSDVIPAIPVGKFPYAKEAEVVNAPDRGSHGTHLHELRRDQANLRVPHKEVPAHRRELVGAATAGLQGVRPGAVTDERSALPRGKRSARRDLGEEDPQGVRAVGRGVRADARRAGWRLPSVRQEWRGGRAGALGGRPLSLHRTLARPALRVLQSATRLGRGHRAEQDRRLSDWRVVSVQDSGRVERVYCAVVPGLHRFVLADGILTGNSVPIPDVAYLKKAIRAKGRVDPSKWPALKALIVKRAKALGATNTPGVKGTWAFQAANDGEALEMSSYVAPHMPAGSPAGGQFGTTSGGGGKQTPAQQHAAHDAHLAHLQHLVDTGKATPAQKAELAAAKKKAAAPGSAQVQKALAAVKAGAAATPAPKAKKAKAPAKPKVNKTKGTVTATIGGKKVTMTLHQWHQLHVAHEKAIKAASPKA